MQLFPAVPAVPAAVPRQQALLVRLYNYEVFLKLLLLTISLYIIQIYEKKHTSKMAYLK